MKLLVLALLVWMPCAYGEIFAPGDNRTDFRTYVAKASHYLRTKQVASPEDAMQIGLAMGYVEGLALMLQSDKVICPPTGSPAKRLDVVFRYLERHPRGDQEVAAVMVMRALGEAFPCPK